MFIASVCPSVRLKPKFGCLKPKFDDDAAGSAKRIRKIKFGPTFYVFYLRPFGREPLNPIPDLLL